MKLMLGTVQFGLDYGVTNSRGRITSDEAVSIFSEAKNAGITMLDSAAGYGESEQVIGKLSGSNFDLVTKTLGIRKDFINAADLSDIRKRLEQSFENFGRQTVYGVLVHHLPDLLVDGGAGVYEILADYKERGLVKKIGVSAYDPESLMRVLNQYSLDLVQVPFNLLDQRFRQSGVLAKLYEQGVEVHARSPFLQGVLLSPPEPLPESMHTLAVPLEKVLAYCKKKECSPLALALAAADQQVEISKIAFGVTSLHELQEIILAYQQSKTLEVDIAYFSAELGAAVDPSKW